MSSATLKTDVEELVQWLAKSGEAIVQFVKSDGSKRTMHCTQKGFAEDERTWGKRNQIVHVWDLEEHDHRAFSKDRVIDWYIAS